MKITMKYDVVDNLPVARFCYKGNHTHPVRRTVLVTESKKTHISGYELREGNIVRVSSNAPIKTYIRSKIAKTNNLRLEQRKKFSVSKSTLVRKTLVSLVETGV